MMKAVLAAAIVATSMNVMAEPASGYAGVSLSSLNYEEPGVDIDLSIAPGVFVGAKLNQFVSLEAELVTGADGDVRIYGQNVDVSVNSILNVGAKFTIPTSSQYVTPYARLGISRGELEVKLGYYSSTDSDTSLAYGFGIQSDINDQAFFQIGYQSYYDKDDIAVNGLRGAVAVKF